MKRPEIVNRIGDTLRQLPTKFTVILFGSEARGDARPDSDIDLLILLDADTLPEKEIHEIKSSLYDIELDSGIIINPIVRLKKEWGKIKTPLYINIQQEGIPL